MAIAQQTTTEDKVIPGSPHRESFDITKVIRGIIYDYNGELLILQRPDDILNASVTYLAACYGVVPQELDKAIQIVADRLKKPSRAVKGPRKKN